MVLGNEGRGISAELESMCESYVMIGMSNQEFPFSLIDSLNVSASWGIIVQKIKEILSSN